MVISSSKRSSNMMFTNLLLGVSLVLLHLLWCVWRLVEIFKEGCGEAFLVSGDKPFRRLEHFRIHDFARRLPTGVAPGGMGVGVASVTSVDAMFKRKRGRPPKNRIIEVSFRIPRRLAPLSIITLACFF